MKDKVDEDVVTEVLAKAEQLLGEEAPVDTENEDPENIPADKQDENVVVENEDEEEFVEEDDKSEDVKINDVCHKVSNAVAKHNASLRRAYNAAAELIGEFNPFGLSEHDMLVKALNHAGIQDIEKASTKELYAMLKVCNSVARVDNAFAYDASTGSEEIEINI